jgi:hypothetical protein
LRPAHGCQRLVAVYPTRPHRMRIEFPVTPVLRVRIVDPLDAATAEKWQGGPHLAEANGAGRI